ncbi:50S ribosomal protein L15 [Euryarchaeota archaeon ex4484_162]|nr:MAG: 50S ribosomal protein L15 [Euryarchaeota archaeon ex4484_162]RLF60682.1 MAG: 50S ribosomal protein L15 [Thermoplasmata archaeon]HDM25670.1 50S ribosomal protein L15 [Thermoplasmatales archaeon]
MSMVKNKTKKYRGSRTHGRGKKAGRGAGLKGGRGNAGLHKHKYMYMLKYMPDHFGRYGFKRPVDLIKEEKTINVGLLEERFPNVKEIDLEKEGFDKLLGSGIVNKPFVVKVPKASKRAIEKIKSKGGKVILTINEVVEEEPE